MSRVEDMTEITYCYAYALRKYLLCRHKIKNIFFFEGNDDVTFYNSFILNYFKEEESMCIIAGCKNDVLKLLEDEHLFENFKFPLFFVDKDFSFWINNVKKHPNLFITEGYSIENYLVSKEILKSVLIENYQFSQIDKYELIDFIDSYQALFHNFHDFFIRFNAILIAIARRTKNFKCGKIIKIKVSDFNFHLVNEEIKFEFNEDKIAQFEELCSKYSISEDEVKLIIIELKSIKEEYYIRGKWILMFFVKYLDFVRLNYKELFESLKKHKLNPSFELNQNNAISILTPKFLLLSPHLINTFLNIHKQT